MARPARSIAGRGLRWALVPAGCLLVVYLLVVGAFFFLQRDMLYQPGGFHGAPSADGPPIQVVGIDTPDGERLVGWYLAPKPGMPTLLFFNGQGGGLEFQGGRWSRIAAEGAGFLSIGYRGHDGSTGRPSEAGLHTDARAAYDWLVQRTRPGDIVIHGYSLGTGVAVRLATERAARALVLEAPYTSTADIAARSYPWLPVRWLMLDQYRSRDVIDQVRCPILIVHGTADVVIPVAQGQTLYDLARAPKRFVRMIGSNHATLTRDGLYDHIWRFLGLPALDSADEGHRAEVAVTDS